jgi:DNA processing protein
MDNLDLPYWLGLIRFRKFGPIRLQKLQKAFPSMKDAFFASAQDLIQAEISPKIAQAFCEARKEIEPEREYTNIIAHDLKILLHTDPAYPELLKEIHNPPQLLFYKGVIPASERQHIAVVGARKPTHYGQRVVERIVAPLAQSKSVIVSGLAYGIDTLAHQATVDVGGTTIAVIGSGLDKQSLYPKENKKLAEEICATGGALISEFPINTPPLPAHFPIRNRIIAGMSSGTLVVEAKQKSGSLITARSALESNRDVYAVPGPIDSELSEGPNNLIKMGATPVTDVSDIIPHLQSAQTITKNNYKPGSEKELSVYNELSLEPTHLDELVQNTPLSASEVMTTLTLMEMKGVVKHIGGQYYIKGSHA